MKLQLQLSPQAELDLIAIWKYSNKNWGETQADHYLDLLDIGMQQIANHSLIGSDYSHLYEGYRKLQIEHHNCFYKAHENVITVVRILHTSMDAKRQLI